MSSDLLHIKDGYFFELPPMLWRSNRQRPSDFPDYFVRNTDDYQAFEAEYLVEQLTELGVDPYDLAKLQNTWRSWQKSDPAHLGWPLDRFLDARMDEVEERADAWADRTDATSSEPLAAYLAERPDSIASWYFDLLRDPTRAERWQEARDYVDSDEFLASYTAQAEWDAQTIEHYNRNLDGLVLIPQPFGQLRNAYEPDSGLCISRYMIIEVFVAILLFVIFRYLARRSAEGGTPRGRLVNGLEAMVQAVRNQIVVPAMGDHDADRFMPLLWTLFFFILGCNLMGMLPFVGAPTAAFGTTAALAAVVFIVGIVMGVKQLGIFGYVKNIVPSLGLPWYLGIIIIPFLWVIEAASLLIKHIVLALRLLLNMAAGHLVLLGILGIGISINAAELPVWQWSFVAAISVIGTTLLNFLELLVAFLQAYVFTFLASMLIGSSIHHH